MYRMSFISLPTRFYTWAWIIWVLWFLVIEALALIDKDRKDTFSEHVWTVRDHGGSLFWFMLAGFLLWLAYHFLFEGKI